MCSPDDEPRNGGLHIVDAGNMSKKLLRHGNTGGADDLPW
jgi:hypothetical protein